MDAERLRMIGRMLRFGAMMARRGPASRFTAADLIERQARRRAGACFVRFEGREVSYAEYNAAANRVAHWALARGIGRGEAVALLMQNRPEYLEVWAGLAKTGATTALLNTHLAGNALAQAIEAGRGRRLIVGEELLDALETLEPAARENLEVWVLSDPARPGSATLPPSASALDPELREQSTRDPDPRVRAACRAGDDLFYIYTSGTTGLPKAARFSHARFFGGGAQSLLRGFGKDDTMYCALPLYHTAGGVICASAVLNSGGTLALRRRFSAREFWKDVVEMRATAFQYIGEFCRYLLNQPESEYERAHAIRFCCGNGLRPDIWERFRDRFRIPHIAEFYGATEANVAMMNLDDTVGSVGKLPPGMGRTAKMLRYDVERDEHVRDAQGRCVECAPGEVGELVGRISEGRTAAGRFEGYTSREASEKKVLRDVFEKGDAWFRTGDLLRFDADGHFYFVDRIGDTFRWKGENVSTQEVAEAVGALPGVELCSVFGVEVPGGDGRAGMAAVVLAKGATLDGKALFGLVQERLPSYAAPLFVRVQDEPEMTGTFKLRKLDLQRQGFDPTLVKDPLYFRDERAQAYVPLTADLFAEIRSRSRRL